MEDAEDLFATITASQEEKLRSCDFVGASPENSNSVSSSPPRTPPQQSGSAGRATSQPYLSGSENPRPNGKEQAHIEVIDLDSDEDGDEVGLIRKKKTAPESHLRESNSCLGKRKLPASMEECEKASDGGVKIGGFKDLMEALQGVLEKAGDGSHGGEGLSLLETAERAGWVFPRPRWWPPEGFED
nr:Kelch repeat-containing protein [Ipomoea batatas]